MTEEPIESKYMDQCYGRDLKDKEIRDLFYSLTQSSVLEKNPKMRVSSVGWNKNLERVIYFRVESIANGTTYLVTVKDGKFRVREETEEYRKYRTMGIPLSFT